MKCIYYFISFFFGYVGKNGINSKLKISYLSKISIGNCNRIITSGDLATEADGMDL